MTPKETEALTGRATRRALYLSLLSIVFCAVLLFGATYAWFTANTSSGVVTMTAANFDVEVLPQTSFGAGEHTVTLQRTGEGSAPGYCVFTLNVTGSYTITTGTVTTITDAETGETKTEDLTTTETVEDSGTHTYYAVFNGTNDTVTFTLTLSNGYTATVEKGSVSWGSYGSGDGTGIRVMAVRRTAASFVSELTDGAELSFGHEDEDLSTTETVTIEAPETTESETTQTETTTSEDGNENGTGDHSNAGNDAGTGSDSDGGNNTDGGTGGTESE